MQDLGAKPCCNKGLAMTSKIEWQDQFGLWRRLTEMNHQPSAFKKASDRAKSTGKRHRIVDEDGGFSDLIDP